MRNQVALHRYIHVLLVLMLPICGLAAELSPGALYEGKAVSERSGRAWPVKLKVVQADASGAFRGELDWTTLSSLHEIRGTSAGWTLTFREVAAIRRGAAHLNCEYALIGDRNSLRGRWIEPGADEGTIELAAMPLPPMQGAEPEAVLFKLESIASVTQPPARDTVFSLDRPALITKIWTYHWNGGRGTAPGTIGLKNTATGQTFGPWSVVATYHMFDSSAGAVWPAKGDGPPFLYWTVQPNVSLPAGTYEVIDSHRASWSTNGEMGNMGCAWVFGLR